MRARLAQASLASRTLAATAVVSVLVAAGFVALIVSIERYRSAMQQRVAVTRLIADANRAEKLLLDVETGERGFVITRDPEFLGPWHKARRSFPPAVASLVERAVVRPEFERRAQVIQRRGLYYLRRWNRRLVQIARRDAAAARRLVATGLGKRQVDLLRAQFASLIEEADADAAAHLRDANAAADRAIAGGVVGIGAALLLMLAYAGYLARHVARPIRRVADAADRVAAGDLSTRASVETGAEAARLARSFNAMAATLERRRDELLAHTRELERAQAETEAATAAAHEASEAKSEFLSRMSHELRTPMNVIIGFAQLLDAADLDAAHQKRVAHILKAGRHLLTLINEVLDISKIEAGAMTLSPEPVGVCAAIDDVIDLCEPLAARRGISLRRVPAEADRAYVVADAQRLRQVLLNLVTNAIKYNRDGGEVTIQPCHLEAGRLRVVVRDTGLGIPADRLDAIFEPFERLVDGEAGIEGTGLGLALSRRLTEAMDGEIGVESTPGVGSSFTLDLDLTAPPAADIPPPLLPPVLAETRTASSRTLLYIEDNLENLELVADVLAPEPGLELVPAMQGKLGLELAFEHRPDLVLLDLNLPDMTGAQVLHRLKNDPRTTATPVIVLSADATERQIERILGQGASAYLTKPLDLDAFRSAVHDAVGAEHV